MSLIANIPALLMQSVRHSSRGKLCTLLTHVSSAQNFHHDTLFVLSFLFDVVYMPLSCSCNLHAGMLNQFMSLLALNCLTLPPLDAQHSYMPFQVIYECRYSPLRLRGGKPFLFATTSCLLHSVFLNGLPYASGDHSIQLIVTLARPIMLPF